MPENENTEVEETQAVKETKEESTPPWKNPEEFDPEKAWKLLQNKDKDLASTKARVAEFEKRAAEAEQAKMSEQEKLQARVEAAEKAAAERETQLLRYQVAAEKGIPADLLQGATKEEMSSYADMLLDFKGKAAPASFDGGQREQAAVGSSFNDQIRAAVAKR